MVSPMVCDLVSPENLRKQKSLCVSCFGQGIAHDEKFDYLCYGVRQFQQNALIIILSHTGKNPRISAGIFVFALNPIIVWIRWDLRNHLVPPPARSPCSNTFL